MNFMRGRCINKNSWRRRRVSVNMPRIVAPTKGFPCRDNLQVRGPNICWHIAERFVQQEFTPTEIDIEVRGGRGDGKETRKDMHDLGRFVQLPLIFFPTCRKGPRPRSFEKGKVFKRSGSFHVCRNEVGWRGGVGGVQRDTFENGLGGVQGNKCTAANTQGKFF